MMHADGSELRYPGVDPGKSLARTSDSMLTLENGVMRCCWDTDGRRIGRLIVQNMGTGQSLMFASGLLPRIGLGSGREIDLAGMVPTELPRAADHAIRLHFEDADSRLDIRWSAMLADHFNAVIQRVELTAALPGDLRHIVFLKEALADARQVGDVDGSVVVCGDIFMGVEHPLAKNVVDAHNRVSCGLAMDSRLETGESVEYSFAVGVSPPGQLRRGFLYYIESRRIHPYRQFLHYNNWYDVWLGRTPYRMTEKDCLDAIEYFGQELVTKRHVEMDAFVWDDGWDDFDTLWDFHQGFPDGFRNLMDAAGAYGADQGVWMSPNGGYSTAKAKRIAYGQPLGYETNTNGFAMGGARYGEAFRHACLKMIRENGVVFFKFDGMGEGGTGKQTLDGAAGALSKDIDSLLELSRELHVQSPDLYVSATVGTWASPFWLLYVDSVWRQGGDTGFYGEGSNRQQWITYRDLFCYERVVQVGPLYPLNSLMLHGIVIGDRPGRAPAGMELDERSVADEIWSFFGSGTCLQELYISPGVATSTMLDQLADAATWARKNQDVLIDTHWIGGSPGSGDIYGWAAGCPGKGTLTLRNPSGESRRFRFRLADLLELPPAVLDRMVMILVYASGPGHAAHLDWEGENERVLELAPFETLVFQCRPEDDITKVKP